MLAHELTELGVWQEQQEKRLEKIPDHAQESGWILKETGSVDQMHSPWLGWKVGTGRWEGRQGVEGGAVRPGEGNLQEGYWPWWGELGGSFGFCTCRLTDTYERAVDQSETGQNLGQWSG